MYALINTMKCDIAERKAENMNYIAAIFCVIALVIINVFGTESKDINTILSTAIMALVWGGVQRGSQNKESDSRTTKKRE